jgi:hypothetical protein
MTGDAEGAGVVEGRRPHQQPRYPMATVLRLQRPSPFCHSACPGVPWERSRISYLTALTGAAYVVLLKENHMQLFEAATLHRKSGEADLSRRAVEESAVRHSGAPNLPVYNYLPFVNLRMTILREL